MLPVVGGFLGQYIMSDNVRLFVLWLNEFILLMCEVSGWFESLGGEICCLAKLVSAEKKNK